jgi:lipoprotein-anchoring transpeptidase ErfK/SrfK
MKVKDFSDYRAPTRRPWLWVVLAIALVSAAVSLLRRCTPADHTPGADDATAPVAGLTVADDGRSKPVRDVPFVPTGDLAGALREVDELIAADDLVTARARLLALLGAGPDDAARRHIERRLGTVNIKLVLTPRQMPEKVEYVVKRGDSVERIARRLGTTIESIQIANGIKNVNLIKAGDRLRVLKAVFAITASKGRNDLVLTMNGAFFKRYATGTGQFGKTPTGTFVIRDKIAEPVWWRPDGKEIPYGAPDNILGTHWLSLRATGATEDVRGYGIHGTWDDSSIGKASSAGCLRMHNSDVEELFTLVPVGAEVTITE